MKNLLIALIIGMFGLVSIAAAGPDRATKEVEKALSNMGVKDISMITVTHKNGKVRQLHSSTSKHVRKQFKDLDIISTTTYQLVRFKGSTCTTWIPGHVEGGAWIDGYCDD